MSGRRILLVLCCLAATIALGVWLLLKSTAESRPLLEAPGVASPPIDPELGRAAVTGPKPAAESGAATPARDAVASAGADLRDGAIDEFTLDGLRVEPKTRARTQATGRVVDDQDKPLAAAKVLASLSATCASAALDALANGGLVREAASDGDGKFRLTQLDPGRLRIEVHADGFAPLIAKETSLPPGESTDLGTFRLARGVVLAGRLLSEERTPLRGAKILLVSAPLLGPLQKLGSFAATPLGRSDEAGQFELASVAAGKVTLLVRSDECPETAFEVDVPKDVARVADLELVLPVGAEIGGHIRDYDERTMKGLSVSAIPVEELAQFDESKPAGANSAWLAGIQSAEVDATGRFTIKALAPGRNFVLRARRDVDAGGVKQEVDAPDPWSPRTTACAGELDAEVVYLPGCRIDFEVVDFSSGAKLEHFRVHVDGTFPEDPLPRVAHVPFDGESSARSFYPGGRVTMQDLRAKKVEEPVDPAEAASQTCLATLSVEAPGFDIARLEGLRLEPGTSLDLGTVQLHALPLLEVRVFDEADTTPLAGASVVLRADHPSRVVGRTRSIATTDGRGLARLTSLPTAAATLSIACAGYAPLQLSAPGQVRFGAPPLDVALVRAARVSVLVLDSRGAGAGAVSVSMQRQAMPDGMTWRRTELSDGSGVALFRDMPAGVFEVAAQSRGGVPTQSANNSAISSSATVIVNSGDQLTVKLEIEACSTLSGTLWLGRDPLSNAQISIESGPRGFRDLGTSMTAFGTAPRFSADAEGAFSNVELLPGDYSLLIEQAGFRVRTLRVVRVERTPTDVIIDVDDTAIIGRVSDPRGRAVAGATVQLFADRPGRRQDIRPLEGDFLVPFEDYRRPIAEALTDALGAYRLRCVPPGVPLEMFFVSGKRSASIPRINVPQGRTLERIDANLPDVGSLDIVLSAPLAPVGLHHGVRIVGVDQPEGLALFGADFDENKRARFDDIPPGQWVVMVFSLNEDQRIAERRKPQTLRVKPGEVTEFSIGW